MEGCCSDECLNYMNLPEDERLKLSGKIEFNGTKFGKGRYKAFNARKTDD